MFAPASAQRQLNFLGSAISIGGSQTESIPIHRHTNSRSLKGTLVTCLVIGVLTAPIHFGFAFILVVPFLIVGALRSIYVAWRQPERRTTLAAKALIWSALMIVVAALHLYYFSAARTIGDETAQAIISFKEKNGRFPSELRELDGDIASRARAWFVFYRCNDDKPFLAYWATQIIYDTYDYDFSTREWTYVSD